MPLRIGLLVALAAVCTAADATAAEKYRDPNVHFTLEIPDGWQMMPAEEIQKLNDALAGLNLGEGGLYQAGFRPRGAEPFALPYVLLQVIPGRFGANHDEVKQTLMREHLANPNRMGNPVVRPHQDRFLFQTEGLSAEGQTTRVMVYGYLGSENTVLLHACTSKDLTQLDRDFPTFERMADSVRFERGHEFTQPGLFADLQRPLPPGQRWVLLPLFGLVAFVFLKVVRIFIRPA
ncbi:MAG TPA: hypothetical protein VFG68_05105 [Fimbriiglobus sp.]|nr:hypothetical protein [Fimbriiglobus sp.]